MLMAIEQSTLPYPEKKFITWCFSINTVLIRSENRAA